MLDSAKAEAAFVERSWAGAQLRVSGVLGDEGWCLQGDRVQRRDERSEPYATAGQLLKPAEGCRQFPGINEAY